MKIILQNICSCQFLSFDLWIPNAKTRTFTNNQLVFRSCWVGQDIVRLNHGRGLSIRNGEVVRRLRRIPGGWWEHAEEVSISGFMVMEERWCKGLRPL
jgi:hypothetical protein